MDDFGKCGFAVSAPEWPRKTGEVEEIRETADEVAAAINSWLDGVLDAAVAATEQGS